MPATTKKVPFLDLKAQYLAIRPEIDAAVARVIGNTSFILGPEVEAFEREFAAYSGFRHVVGVANGTDALVLIMRAMGLAPGFEAVAPAHTFMATTEAVTQAGGRPTLCDVDATTFCMTAETLERAWTPATRVVLPVPIYGNPAGLDGVLDAARRRGVATIVDCAQGHGVRVNGRRLGELADVASYSFFPGKNLGAYGDAGAVATNDDALAAKVRMWRNHGREGKFDHQFEGVNSRLDALQAAILRAKLPHLTDWSAGRRRVARLYREALSGIPGLRLPEETEGAEHVYHVYVVRVADREGVRAALEERGVATGVHYPLPVHLLPAYAYLGLRRGSFPTAEAICDTILSLPMFPEMTAEDVHYVADALRGVLEGRAA
ncbi:MAG TPA: DegT/DnrJ/EryC1/StrS family aminotransferase [Candidatus Polarisedimenticolaceae bacterium]